MNKKASLALASLSLIISAEVLVSHFGLNLPLTQVFSVSAPSKAVEPAAIVMSNKNTAAIAVNTGAVITAASCSQADVQSALNAATDGTTVIIPPGTCSWPGGVSLSAMNRSVYLQGSGIDKTIINAPTYTVVTDAANGRSFSVSHIRFEGTGQGEGPYMLVRGDSKNWRIHNIYFNNPPGRTISVQGESYGLIDHTIARGATPSQYVLVQDSHNSTSWNIWKKPLVLGDKNAVYVEDNDVAWTGHWEGRPFIDGDSGGRAVVRYNKVMNAMFGSHGFDSGDGSSILRLEVYNNEMTITDSMETWARFGLVRGGTGVWFNNKATYGPKVWIGGAISLSIFRNHMAVQWKACDGTQYKLCSNIDQNWNLLDGTWSPMTASSDAQCSAANIRGGGTKDYTAKWKFCSGSNMNLCTVDSDCPVNETCSGYVDGNGPAGYACRMQPGRGANNQLTPMYEWNNIQSGSLNLGTADIDFASENPQIVEGRDFFNDLPMPGYTPYTYPHPFQTSLTGTNPPPSSYTFSVAKNGTGSGTVTSLGGGINCGTTCIATNVSGGTTATLTASPSQGSVFAGWGGACSGTGTCVVTINGNITVTATFNLETTPPPPPSDIPTVSTSSASPITSSSATLNGSITSTGGSEVTVSGFEYGLTTAYGYSRSTEGSNIEGFFSEVISDLSCSTTYNFRAFARNSFGTGYGSNQSFTTGSCSASDKNAPTSPSNLSTPTVTSSQVSLKWSPSTDDTAVTGYRVHRNGVAVANITGTQYTNSGLDPLTLYSFDVFAYDAAGNISIPASISATTLNSPTIKVGSTVKALTTLKVRSSPAILPKNTVGQQKRGATGTVTGGPVTASGYVWWQVNFASGTDGWVAAPNITAI